MKTATLFLILGVGVAVLLIPPSASGFQCYGCMPTAGPAPPPPPPAGRTGESGVGTEPCSGFEATQKYEITCMSNVPDPVCVFDPNSGARQCGTKAAAPPACHKASMGLCSCEGEKCNDKTKESLPDAPPAAPSAPASSSLVSVGGGVWIMMGATYLLRLFGGAGGGGEGVTLL